ncbi:alcohol dehydrogenase [Aspergillus nomiae NRRL 13137]|uniref:Alcohol dehydrogenase n=1 Tax=Aspergillus nomiae NRRL (strain ATCC 15546 / NRRL 13137 / CBS 260.88 / M93) TaxID=1509407 RepID=A0A0L1IVD2_ASPN3|nr:alcohol dehydrogenase [Aspergillus nomiae NRRL 13137]KNG83434.1 alcohol dehydrogenase [Aspergillus nomiae NRRL 13137]
MKAARFYAAGDIRIEEVNAPEASDEKALVQVEWCGICGSDLNEYIHGPMAIPHAGPHPLTGDILPVTLGHEVSGRIIQAPSTSSLSPGQAVIIDPRFYCSSCTACTSSVTNCCQSLGFLGLSGGGGGFSEKVAVPPAMLHPIPDNTDMATATLIEPLAVAWHGVRCSGVQDFKGLPVLVVGGGPVGVATVFVLRAWGADTIYVSETARRRREFLQDLVQATFDPMEVNVGSECKTLTNGSGVGMVFDCAGSQQGLEAASDGLRFHGLYINLAVPKAPISLPVGYFMFKELTYKAFLAYDNADFKATVAAFVEGRFAGVERMITRRIALEDLVDKGFKTLLQNADEHIKIVATAGELPPTKSTL